MSNYTAPPFSPDPTYYPLPSYTLVVHKQGSLLHSIPLPTDVSFLVIGRGEGCELEIEHASSSRFHAVLQHSVDRHIHLYDLDSTHGTILNKKRIPPKQYIELKHGDQIAFGASNRVYTIEMPIEMQPTEAEIMQYQQMAKEAKANPVPKPQKILTDADVINNIVKPSVWGMQEDDETKQRLPKRDAYYQEDPKKSLRNWFEKENLDFSFRYTGDGGPNHDFTAHITVPGLDDEDIEGTGVASRRKDAEKAACLHALEQMDVAGYFDESAEKIARKKRNRLKRLLDDNDNDDDFFDRTIKPAKKSVPAPAAVTKVESFLTPIVIVPKSTEVNSAAHISKAVQAPPKSLPSPTAKLDRTELRTSRSPSLPPHPPKTEQFPIHDEETAESDTDVNDTKGHMPNKVIEVPAPDVGAPKVNKQVQSMMKAVRARYETKVEQIVEDDVDLWTPPLQPAVSKQEELKKRLGY